MFPADKIINLTLPTSKQKTRKSPHFLCTWRIIFFYFKALSLYWVILIIERGMEAIHIMSPLLSSWNIYRSKLEYINSREVKYWRDNKKREGGWGRQDSAVQGGERKEISLSELTFLILSFWRRTINEPDCLFGQRPCFSNFLLPNAQQHKHNNFISNAGIIANIRQLWA